MAREEAGAIDGGVHGTGAEVEADGAAGADLGGGGGGEQEEDSDSKNTSPNHGNFSYLEK
jgi:hypothetical protein